MKFFQKYKLTFTKEEYDAGECLRLKYIRLVKFNRVLLFQLVTITHLVWALYLILDPTNHTHKVSLEDILSPLLSVHLTGILLLFSCVSAMMALYMRFKNPFWRAALLIPQQFFLTLSAIVAISKAYDRGYITMGKVAVVAIAVAHSVSLFYNFILLPIKLNGEKITMIKKNVEKE